MSSHLAVIDPQDLPEVERLRTLIGVEIYTDHLSNALAAFARGEGKPARWGEPTASMQVEPEYDDAGPCCRGQLDHEPDCFAR